MSEPTTKPCYICADRQWMILVQNPMRRDMDLVAPCVGCSPSLNLHDIEKARGMRLIRGDCGWQEMVLQ